MLRLKGLKRNRTKHGFGGTQGWLSTSKRSTSQAFLARFKMLGPVDPVHIKVIRRRDGHECKLRRIDRGPIQLLATVDPVRTLPSIISERTPLALGFYWTRRTLLPAFML